MKDIRKLLKVSVFGIFLILFVVACGSNNEDGQSENAQGDTNNQEVNEESNGVTELSIFVDHSFWPLTDWSGVVAEEITKQTGVKLDVQVASDGQQLPLMISSGNLPDLVFTQAYFQEMSNANISYTWDELIEDYDITDFEIDPMARTLNQAEDGNLYSVKNGFTTPEDFHAVPTALGNVPALSYRTDIMEELGNPELETLEDLVDVFKSVQELYPDMRPLVLSPVALTHHFAVNFGASYLQNFQMVDGELKYYIAQPQQYDLYMFMNRLYREGIISAENFSWSDQNQPNAMIANGEAFAIANNTDMNTINSEIEATGADFRIDQLTKLLGENPSLETNSAGWSGTFITKSANDPEAAIKFLQFMKSEEGQKLGLWGIEGEHWTMEETLENGGYPEFTYDSQNAVDQKEIGSVWWGLLANDGIYEQVQRYVPGTSVTEAMVDAKQYTNNNPLIAGVQLPVDSEAQLIKAELDNMIRNEETKIFLAETEEEATKAYENMMEIAKDIGVETLNEYVSAAYIELEKEYEKAMEE